MVIPLEEDADKYKEQLEALLFKLKESAYSEMQLRMPLQDLHPLILILFGSSLLMFTTPKNKEAISSLPLVENLPPVLQLVSPLVSFFFNM